jgi:hypothetical protein
MSKERRPPLHKTAVRVNMPGLDFSYPMFSGFSQVVEARIPPYKVPSDLVLDISEAYIAQEYSDFIPEVQKAWLKMFARSALSSSFESFLFSPYVGEAFTEETFNRFPYPRMIDDFSEHVLSTGFVDDLFSLPRRSRLRGRFFYSFGAPEFVERLFDRFSDRKLLEELSGPSLDPKFLEELFDEIARTRLLEDFFARFLGPRFVERLSDHLSNPEFKEFIVDRFLDPHAMLKPKQRRKLLASMERGFDEWRNESRYVDMKMFRGKRFRSIKPILVERTSDRSIARPFLRRNQRYDEPLVSVTNPFLIPIAFYMIMICGIMRTVFSTLPRSGTSRKRYTRYLLPKFFERFLLLLFWDLIAESYQKRRGSKLSGLKGAIFLSQAAMVSQMGGFAPEGHSWGLLKSNIEDKDPRLKVSRILYEMVQKSYQPDLLVGELRNLVYDMKTDHKDLLVCAGLLDTKGNCTISA